MTGNQNTSTLVFFEPIDTIRQILAKTLIELLDNYALKRKIIAYIKDEGSNLNIMIINQNSIINCGMLCWRKVFKALVLGMHFPKFTNMLQKKENFAKIYNVC
jgi:hypothetical protein